MKEAAYRFNYRVDIMKGYRLVSVTIIIFVLSISSLVRAERISWHASGKGGVVASTGRDAVPAGISILEQGGNAADAASAMLLALSITEYGVYTIGAEVPLIIYDAKKEEVKVLSGLGAAPLDPKAMDWYYENGIPSSGGIKASPVPGAMGLCIDLVKLNGTMRFEEVAAPTLEMLDDGDEEWQENLAVTFRKLIETERNTEGSREEKLQAARDRFYKGDIADALEAFYIREGGFLRKKDLAAHVTRIEEPVKVEYRGYTVYKCGTWTQGPYLCQTLKLLEGFNLKKMGRWSADYFHVLTEALKLALADRDEYYGDPLFADVPMEALLSDVYNQIRRPLIDMSKASAEVRPGDPINMKALKGPGQHRPGPGGTTTCVVADKWGNMVSATPSGNSPYTVCAELGLAHGNRLRSLNTTPGHPNRIEQGKRPRITLTPTLVLKDGKPIAAISVAGGDFQDQTALVILLNMIEFGMLPKDALQPPRLYSSHHENSFDPAADRKDAMGGLARLLIDKEAGEDVIEELEKRGHRVRLSSEPVGYPVMLYVDPESGMMYAAGDPKTGAGAGAVGKTTP